MKRVSRLTEKDLSRIIKRVINEGPEGPEMPEVPTPEMEDIMAKIDSETDETNDDIVQPIAEYWFNRRMLRSNKTL